MINDVFMADIDECLTPNICPASLSCINKEGSHECRCSKGEFYDVVKNQCVDVDECAEGTSLCDHTCINLPKSYRCECDKGYKLADDRHACIDIDECEDSTLNTCGQECRNTPGGFECGCGAGDQRVRRDGQVGRHLWPSRPLQEPVPGLRVRV
ncbi:unnamed protein product [Vitrella brassicaformis CCMP3155]|uniref:EGF-like domain-containing protein n=1 Tax=Vitrella brassicaformis (strain CCMP3155) TaxID=1169540 RepID=A0A0G4EV35_VITBC|nr:unnamed protein product [Vitrella brassicaformis CCMP3155]|eukprot:CEM01907.1 unnamed protein product [Vitrella brassicaformis CCMP3155]